tara:strand:+ start:2382 stop:2801 length:420 start_codon:yes stop_codon:yes gene_type:complete
MPTSWKTDVGVNHVGAYQVSGRPYATGSIDATGSADAVRVEFPKVTRWVQVINRDDVNPCKVAFSRRGLAHPDTEFHFFVGKSQTAQDATDSAVYELKVSELFLTGSGVVDVVAGLTNIDIHRVSSSVGPNWSGSVGVG